MKPYALLLPCLVSLWLPGLSLAANLQVAVASNFANTLEVLAESFRQETGHPLLVTTGSTGKFYQQIRQGAPFEVFLSADSRTPEKLEQENLGVAGTRLTYATGHLVLWSKHPGMVDAEGQVLKQNTFRHLAIANPATAPYGTAAMEVMKNLGILEQLQPLLVQGENIAQTYQFVDSGNAEIGFVAAAQVMWNGKPRSGSAWLVPDHLHSPLHQDAILLKNGERNPVAQQFMLYLQSDRAKAIISRFGYTP